MKIKQHPYAGLKEVTRWGVVRILQVSLSHVGSTDLLYTHFPQEKHKVKLYFGDNRGPFGGSLFLLYHTGKNDDVPFLRNLGIRAVFTPHLPGSLYASQAGSTHQS